MTFWTLISTPRPISFLAVVTRSRSPAIAGSRQLQKQCAMRLKACPQGRWSAHSWTSTVGAMKVGQSARSTTMRGSRCNVRRPLRRPIVGRVNSSGIVAMRAALKHDERIFEIKRRTINLVEAGRTLFSN